MTAEKLLVSNKNLFIYNHHIRYELYSRYVIKHTHTQKKKHRNYAIKWSQIENKQLKLMRNKTLICIVSWLIRFATRDHVVRLF